MKNHVMAYFISVVMFLLFISTAGAQGTWTTYTEEDGLFDNYIPVIAVDENNVKWFGSSHIDGGGVSSFDGITWTTYIHEFDSIGGGVQSITVDDENVKWFSFNGVISFKGAEWNAYPDERTSGVAIINDSLVDQNNIRWFCKGDDLISFDGNDWISHLHLNEIFRIAIDSSNVIWMLSTVGIGDPGNFELWKYNGFDLIQIPIDFYHTGQSIAVDKDNVIWIGTWDGIISFNGETWQSYPDNPLSNSIISSIAVDENNVKWFTGYPGVLSYDGKRWTHYTTADGLVDDHVLAVAIDHDGVKWFGTQNGVSSYDDQPVAVETASTPGQLSVTGNYPSPFNPDTTIEFSLSTDTFVTLDIYNLSGQRVITLLDDMLGSGTHSVVWDGVDDAGADVSSGVYFCRLQADGKIVVHRMVLMR